MKLTKEFVIREVAGETVAVPVGSDDGFSGYIRLNGVGRFIFESFSGGFTVDETVAKLVKKYDVSEAKAKTDTEAFAEKLRKAGLIED